MMVKMMENWKTERTVEGVFVAPGTVPDEGPIPQLIPSTYQLHSVFFFLSPAQKFTAKIQLKFDTTWLLRFVLTGPP